MGSFRNPAMMAQSPKAAATLASKAFPLTLSSALPPSSEELLAPKREAISVRCGACERSENCWLLCQDRQTSLVTSEKPEHAAEKGKKTLANSNLGETEPSEGISFESGNQLLGCKTRLL